MSDRDLQQWITKILKKESVTEFKLGKTGDSANGEGFMGDIVFLTVTCSSKPFHFVIKHGKKSPALRKSIPTREIFLNEIAIYDEIFPEFQKFQRDRHVSRVFDAFPVCYGTLIEDAMEVIVLQNMKHLGYDSHDQLVPLDREHVHLVLREYGRLHAISLAMKDQDEEKFSELIGSVKYVLRDLYETGGAGEIFKSTVQETAEILRKTNNGNVADKLVQIVEHIPKLLLGSEDNNDEYSVIIHGDGWNNNFMFKYKDGKTPEKVCILDWQAARYGSPTIDLAFFIFCCCSSTELNDIDNLLHIYHNALSESLLELGSDPEKLFPFSKLMEHWKKYGVFGVIQATMLVKVMFCSTENIPDLAGNAEKGNDLGQLLDFTIKDQHGYQKRLLDVTTNQTFFDAIKYY